MREGRIEWRPKQRVAGRRWNTLRAGCAACWVLGLADAQDDAVRQAEPIQTGIEEGLEVIRQCGFLGECEVECRAYQVWLGRRHTGRV
jgi:hypothetical protein